MINLIPPNAKKKIIMEYWIRVVSVWFYLWSGAFVLGIFIMVPTYVLITLQVSAYETSSEVASKKIADYESVSKNLTYSSSQAKKLVDGLSDVSMSSYINLFGLLENNQIVLSQITIQRSDEKTNTVQLVGEASNRQALAAFRDRLVEEKSVVSVDLPISNLAKDKEIPFSITVMLSKEVTP